MMEYCTSADHENLFAVRYVSCEKEGAYPYCQACADILLSGGEIDHGPVSVIPDDEKYWRSRSNAERAEVERLRGLLERIVSSIEDGTIINIPDVQHAIYDEICETLEDGE